MKTYMTLTIESIVAAVFYSLWFGDKLKAFIDGLSIIFIVFIIIGGFFFLERGGYFDIYGYTFAKTAAVLRRKTDSVESTAKLKSLYAYKEVVNEKRLTKDNRFLIVAGVLGFLATGLSLIFYR
jgi:hypothetical protein